MKKAFSLIELFIVVFIIGAVIFTVVPCSISNKQQVKLIAEWKNYIEQVNYSYETLIEYRQNTTITKEEATKKFMSYLDAKKTQPNNEKYKQYSFKLLNYGPLQKDKLDKFDEVYVDIKNRIIGINYNETCSDDSPCATIWTDLNGVNKPNRVGKDIFVYEVFPNNIEPYKKNTPFETLKNDCTNGTGLSCSKFFLLGGNIK